VRIGLTSQDFLGWQGGRELFALIGSALLESLEPGDTLSHVPRAGQENVVRRFRRLLRPAPAPPDFALPIAQEQACDVLGPFVVPPIRPRAPILGFVPDLQHRHLPQLFSPRELAGRDRVFGALLAEAGAVLVNSRAAEQDLRRFYPGAKARIVTLPFAACPEPDWFETEVGVPARYGIEGPFFLCSNQFWKHKNHGLLLEAAALARREGAPVRIVMTGATTDYRHPHHHAQLLQQIERTGIGEDVHLLGFIPKQDQLALMRAAVAVVQPSLFEGGPGGGAVYNAIALGRPAIVSDLPVNREIETKVAGFFDPGDPADLLRALRAVAAMDWLQETPDALLRAGQAGRRAFGQALHEAFAAAAQEKPGSSRSSDA
jgi:glycosyltransferase involved in cell wall biosynthesis